MEKKPSKNPVIVIIPMGIPAIGKSKIFEAVLKNKEAMAKFNFVSVSSDDVRKQCMEQYLATNPGISRDDAFNNTQVSYRKAFHNALRIK